MPMRPTVVTARPVKTRTRACSPTACAAVTAGSSAVQTELTNATGNSSSGMAMPEITPSADSACS